MPSLLGRQAKVRGNGWRAWPRDWLDHGALEAAVAFAVSPDARRAVLLVPSPDAKPFSLGPKVAANGFGGPRLDVGAVISAVG